MKTIQEQIRFKYLGSTDTTLYKQHGDSEDAQWRKGYVRYVGKKIIIIIDGSNGEEYSGTVDTIKFYDFMVDTKKMKQAYLLAKAHGEVMLTYDEFRVRPHAYMKWFAVADCAKEMHNEK